MRLDGSQNNEISCSFMECWQILAEDQAELLYDTRLPKQVKTIQEAGS